MAAQRAPRGLVAARLLGLASTVLALACGAHVLGGGTLPSGPALGALAALTAAATGPLARTALRVRTVLPVAAVAQGVLHVVLGALSHVPVGAVPAGPVSMHLAHAGHGGHLGVPAPGSGALGPDVMGGTVPGALDAAAFGTATLGAAAQPAAHTLTAAMLVAHVVGTLLTVALLVGADRAAGLARTWWAHVSPALLRPRVVVAVRVRTWPDVVVLPPRTSLLGTAARRRGPPVGSPLPV